MLCFLFSAFASEPTLPPGTLSVDSKLPAEVLVDGIKLVQLWHPGTVSFEVEAGPHALRIYTNGNPADHALEIVSGSISRVLVGRTGTTLEDPKRRVSDADGTVPVELRVVGTGARVFLGEQRLSLSNGERTAIELSPGDHALSVRSQDGTAIWARGTLEVGVGEPLIVQITEGRLPELSGAGSFRTGG